MTNVATEREFGWNDTIEKDGDDFVVFEAGDYDAVIKLVEKARHTPNPKNPGKLPACNKAVVHVTINNGIDEKTIKHNLFLHSRCEGMLCQFFTSIGLRKHGEPLRMDWSRVPGCKCKVKITKDAGNDKDVFFNNIKKFLEPEQVNYSTEEF